MMKIYNVGPDELSFNKEDYETSELVAKSDNIEWIVYWYESGYYEGSGYMIICDKEGNLRDKGLGHCSCYGPVDGWNGISGDIVTVENLERGTDYVYGHDYESLVIDKVKELLGA